MMGYKKRKKEEKKENCLNGDQFTPMTLKYYFAWGHLLRFKKNP